LSLCLCWKEANEIRIPIPLRIVNEGLTVDGNYWYLTNQHVLFKSTIFPMNITIANYDAIPPELRKRRFDHIGDIDIDVSTGIIYGGFESSTEDIGIIASWNSTDLSLIKYVETTQSGMPWVAVDPSKRLLYSAVWGSCCYIEVYDMDTFAYHNTITASNGLPSEIQGGAFYQSELYMFVNGNVSVYSMNMDTYEVSFVLSISNDIKYPNVYESEGLAFWDFTKQGFGMMHMYGNFDSISKKAIRSYSP